MTLFCRTHMHGHVNHFALQVRRPLAVILVRRLETSVYIQIVVVSLVVSIYGCIFTRFPIYIRIRGILPKAKT
jgi:hypothetical protein